MEAINYAPNGQNMILSEDAQIVQGVSGNAVYLPIGAGTIAIAGDRNELSVSLWRQWDGVVEADASRGVFSFKNISVFFDQQTDLLTVVINGFKAITDIKDDQKQAHWCFTFAKNGRFTVYKDAKEAYSLSAGDKPVDMADGFTLGGGKTHATFDEVRVYKTVLKQGEINGLFYLVSKGTQVKQLESIVQGYTPKYLGVTETVPTTRTVYITKGEKLGAQDAHAGDWVLMAKTLGGWKCGVCYRWTGSMWINLEPEYNYTEQYQAALYHICEIPELMKNTGHFGALFAKVIVAQQALIDTLVTKEAFIDKLIAQEAFINKLAAEQAFLRQLVVQQLKIDSDTNSHQDFEAWFDQLHGLEIKNKGEEIFKVDTAGNIFAKNATLVNGRFSGSINTPVFEITKETSKTNEIAINTNETLKSVYSRSGRFYYECIDKNKNIDLFKAQMSYFDYRNDKRKIPLEIAGHTYWIDVVVDQDIYQLDLHTSQGILTYRYVETLSSTNISTMPIGIRSDERVPKNILLGVKEGSSTIKVKNIPSIPGQSGCLYTYTLPFLDQNIKFLCVSP